jgi:hypothetical protein
MCSDERKFVMIYVSKTETIHASWASFNRDKKKNSLKISNMLGLLIFNFLIYLFTHIRSNNIFKHLCFHEIN